MALVPMRFAILGPGGVGGLLAALLARARDSVLVLAGSETAAVIATRGIRLESVLFGDFTAAVRVAESLDEPVDACFITVKSTHLHEALKRVPRDAVGDGLVIPLLNGLEHVETLRSIYPPAGVVAGTIRVETDRPQPGVIRHTSPFAAVEMAASPANRAQVEKVVEHLKAAGLSAQVRDDEAAMLWDKFAMLAPMALLTTHERANLGVIRTRRRSDTVAVISEVASVANAEGIAIDSEKILGVFDSAPGEMGTSMQRDQSAGRPLELDSIGGVILRRAAKARIAVPVTERIVADLRARAAPAS